MFLLSDSTAPYALWSCFNFESHRASRTPPARFCVLANYAAGMGAGVVCVFWNPERQRGCCVATV